MDLPLIAHRCGRAYGPDSSRQALRAALAGGRLCGVETDLCLTRDGALACLTTRICRSGPRSPGGRTSGAPPICSRGGC